MSQGQSHLSIVRPTSSAANEPLKGKRAVTRHRLMNACMALICRSGFQAVSMTAIAEEAGITRQTVYRYFANSSEVISATLLRAGREIQEAMCLVYQEPGDPRDLIVEAVMTALRLTTHNVLIVKALSSGGSPKDLFSATMQEEMVGRTIDALKPIGEQVGWDEAECREVNEILVRTINSFLMMPVADQSEKAIRDGLHKRLIPALGL